MRTARGLLHNTRTMLRLAAAALLLSACIGDNHPSSQDPEREDVDATLREFSGCPRIADFEATQFGVKWSALSSADGACATCHLPSEPGVDGFGTIHGDAADAHAQVTGTLEQLHVFFTVEGDEVVINDGHFTSSATAAEPFVGHARYDLDANGAWDALLQIYTDSRQRFADGTCDQPQF